MPLTPEQRKLRASIAAHAMHARHDSRETTQAAREAFREKFLLQVDPKGELPPDERARRAASAHKAHMRQLAYKSVKARQKRKGGKPPRPAEDDSGYASA